MIGWKIPREDEGGQDSQALSVSSVTKRVSSELRSMSEHGGEKKTSSPSIVTKVLGNER